MDQLPYYVVVSKLEAQNSALMSEQREFRIQVDQHGTALEDMSKEVQVRNGVVWFASDSFQTLKWCLAGLSDIKMVLGR
jgi:hypothetical protein